MNTQIDLDKTQVEEVRRLLTTYSGLNLDVRSEEDGKIAVRICGYNITAKGIDTDYIKLTGKG